MAHPANTVVHMNIDRGDGATYAARTFLVLSPTLENEAAIRDAVKLNALCPAKLTPDGVTLYRKPIDITTDQGITYANVTWERRRTSEAGGTEIGRILGFDTTGGTTLMTQSLYTVGAYAPAGQTAPDFQGAIGVGEDGEVAGVEVPTPSFRFQVEALYSASDVPATKLGAWVNLYGRVNNATVKVKGYANDDWVFFAGELRYMGGSGQDHATEGGKIRVVHNFDASPNMVNIQVGNITGISKNGWDYLWVRYGKHADSATGVVVQQPIAAYVEEVHYRGDFSVLGAI
jgi:hypothetical protein